MSPRRLPTTDPRIPDVIVAAQDLDLRYTWLVDPTGHERLVDAVGRTDADLFSPRDAGRLQTIKREVIDAGESRHLVGQLVLGGRPELYLVTVEPLRTPGRETVGVTVVFDGLGDAEWTDPGEAAPG